MTTGHTSPRRQPELEHTEVLLREAINLESFAHTQHIQQENDQYSVNIQMEQKNCNLHSSLPPQHIWQEPDQRPVSIKKEQESNDMQSSTPRQHIRQGSSQRPVRIQKELENNNIRPLENRQNGEVRNFNQSGMHSPLSGCIQSYQNIHRPGPTASSQNTGQVQFNASPPFIQSQKRTQDEAGIEPPSQVKWYQPDRYSDDPIHNDMLEQLITKPMQLREFDPNNGVTEISLQVCTICPLPGEVLIDHNWALDHQSSSGSRNAPAPVLAEYHEPCLQCTVEQFERGWKLRTVLAAIAKYKGWLDLTTGSDLAPVHASFFSMALKARLWWLQNRLGFIRVETERIMREYGHRDGCVCQGLSGWQETNAAVN